MKRAEDGVCVCLKRRGERESLNISAVARAVQPAVREFERTWSVPVCCNAEAARPREARGVCVIASGDNPTAAQYVPWRCRRESAWVPRERKVTKAVRSKKGPTAALKSWDTSL